MRRQHFEWTFVVTGLVLTIYGAYSVIYNHMQGRDIPILGLVFLIVGVALLLVYLVLAVITIFQRKHKKVAQPDICETTEVEEKKEEPQVEEPPVVAEKPSPELEYTQREKSTYTRNKSIYDFDGGSGYVSKVGFGPVLRVENERILDMRSNTYYCIEGNLVKELGSGPVFEISGNRIRLAFGGYLYEISGSNVNKTYGGFYASFNGNYLQTHDLREKYEMPSNLNMKQKLAVVALLFGQY